MLFADLVAAEPVEVVPVVHLVVELGDALLVTDPDAAASPVDAATEDLANEAGLDLFQSFTIAVLVVTLQADGDVEILLLGFFDRSENLADTGSIDRDRLFHEDVFVLLDGVFDVGWAEAGRGGEDDHVAARIDGFLIGIKAAEFTRADVDLFGTLFSDITEVVGSVIDRVFEVVGEGDDDGVGVGFQSLSGGTGAAAAATDQSDLDRGFVFAIGGVSAECEGSGAQGTSLEEAATVRRKGSESAEGHFVLLKDIALGHDLTALDTLLIVCS